MRNRRQTLMCQAGTFLLMMVFLFAGFGCSDRTETVYQETAPAASPRVPAQSGPSDGEGPTAKTLTWDRPAGWAEGPAGGMRLASFQPLPGNESLICTLVPLKGQAGGLVPNVTRWLEQMGEPAPEPAALEAFLEAQETFSTAGGFSGRLVDLSAWGTKSGDDRPVILAAVLTLDADTLFVKMQGPAALVRAQKEAFLLLCRSIRPGEAR